MTRDNRPLSEQLYEAGMAYADAYAAAQLLEEGKSAFLAQRMKAEGDIPVSKAELLVKASEEYSSYIKSMVKARQNANRLKVRLDYLKARMTEWQSQEANHRLVTRGAT